MDASLKLLDVIKRETGNDNLASTADEIDIVQLSRMLRVVERSLVCRSSNESPDWLEKLGNQQCRHGIPLLGYGQRRANSLLWRSHASVTISISHSEFFET